MHWNAKPIYFIAAIRTAYHLKRQYIFALLISLGFLPDADAQANQLAYVINIQGSVTLSVEPYINNFPVASGAIIPTSANINLKKSSKISILCGSPVKIHQISTSINVGNICPTAQTSGENMRAGDNNQIPILLFPRHHKISGLDKIIWGNQKKSSFAISIQRLANGNHKEVMSINFNDPPLTDRAQFNIYQYELPPNIQRALLVGEQYQIIISNTKTGKRSESDDFYNGILTLTENLNLDRDIYGFKQIKKETNNPDLRHYFASILLQEKNHHYESMNMLAPLKSEKHAQYLQFQKANIYIGTGAPADYSAYELLETLTKSMLASDPVTGLLACERLQTIHPLLSAFWKKKLERLTQHSKFSKICPILRQ